MTLGGATCCKMIVYSNHPMLGDTTFLQLVQQHVCHGKFLFTSLGYLDSCYGNPPYYPIIRTSRLIVSKQSCSYLFNKYVTLLWDLSMECHGNLSPPLVL